MSYYRDQLESYLKTQDVAVSSVLDIGGGANPIMKRVRNFVARYYYILDNKAEEMKQEPDFVQNMNYEFDLGMMFDTIFCLEVFEYIFDPIVALGNIRRHLKQFGLAYITFPTLYPLHNPEGIDCLRYTVEGIKTLLEETQFEIVDLIPRMANESGKIFLSNFWSADGMHPRKHNEHVYATGYIAVVKRK